MGLSKSPQKWVLRAARAKALVVVRFGNVLAVEAALNLQATNCGWSGNHYRSGDLSIFHDDSRGSSTGFAGFRNRSRWWSIHAQYGATCQNCWLGKDLIRLSGYEVNIDILFTGLRPGEKLNCSFRASNMNQPSTKKLLLSATPVKLFRKSWAL